jgi:hypothetical protein
VIVNSLHLLIFYFSVSLHKSPSQCVGSAFREVIGFDQKGNPRNGPPSDNINSNQNTPQNLQQPIVA